MNGSFRVPYAALLCFALIACGDEHYDIYLDSTRYKAVGISDPMSRHSAMAVYGALARAQASGQDTLSGAALDSIIAGADMVAEPGQWLGLQEASGLVMAKDPGAADTATMGVFLRHAQHKYALEQVGDSARAKRAAGSGQLFVWSGKDPLRRYALTPDTTARDPGLKAQARAPSKDLIDIGRLLSAFTFDEMEYTLEEDTSFHLPGLKLVGTCVVPSDGEGSGAAKLAAKNVLRTFNDVRALVRMGTEPLAKSQEKDPLKKRQLADSIIEAAFGERYLWLQEQLSCKTLYGGSLEVRVHVKESHDPYEPNAKLIQDIRVVRLLDPDLAP